MLRILKQKTCKRRQLLAAFACLNPAYMNRAFVRQQQAIDQPQERAFSRAIIADDPDPAFSQRNGKPFENQVFIPAQGGIDKPDPKSADICMQIRIIQRLRSIKVFRTKQVLVHRSERLIILLMVWAKLQT